MKKPKYTLTFLNKQPVYKQLALEQQIAKQISGFSLLSLSNNKNCRLKKSFPFVINIKLLGQQIYTPKFSCLESIIGKILKLLIIKFNSES